MDRPILLTSDGEQLRQMARRAITECRARQQHVGLAELDTAITEALWHTNDDNAQIGYSHERQMLFALAWFAMGLGNLSSDDAQSVARRLHQIERLAGQLADLAARKAEAHS